MKSWHVRTKETLKLVLFYDVMTNWWSLPPPPSLPLHPPCPPSLLFHPSFPLSPSPLQRPHHAHALFDFTGHHPSQLRFLRGDVIELIDCSDSQRWRGRCHGRIGSFPPEYVQPIYQQWPDMSIKHTTRSLISELSWPHLPHTAPLLFTCLFFGVFLCFFGVDVWRAATELLIMWLTAPILPVKPPVNHKPCPISCYRLIHRFYLIPQLHSSNM